MNVFFIIDGTAITPTVKDTVLDGITRDSAIQVLQDMGIPTEERPLSIDEIFEAYDKGKLDDAFGSGTAASIIQISAIGHKGVRRELRPSNERTISNELKNQLEGIKRGLVEDKYGWTRKV